MNTLPSGAGPVDTAASSRTLLDTLPFSAARFTGGFWSRYQEINRSVSLQHGYAMLEQAGNFRNLRIAAGRETGSFTGRNFYDEDIYKWLEALGWELGRAPDPELQRMADEAIELIAAAQQPDGYLDSYYQVAEPGNRWTDLDHGHELFCAGHLIQAAIAFQRALGDSRLLEVVRRLVDHIDSVFGPGKLEGTGGHPEIETALVELYRVTGEPRDLALAQFLIDQRGRGRMRGYAGYGADYHQDHVPVRQAGEMAGHAVRQLYLNTGVTDLYMETGEAALIEAMNRLWTDLVARKLYITGGVGSRFDGEAFGAPYELPSDQCYCETCAAIGSLMWNWRLLLLTGERRYADLFERTLYNGVLSSPSLDGAHFFYANPLQVRSGRYVRASANPPEGEVLGRPAWHEVACCPPNVMRLLSSLGHYLATADGAGVQIHQYAAAHVRAEVNGAPVSLEIDTEYPWDGRITLRVAETPADEWALRLRVPAWCRTSALALNGEQQAAAPQPNGYLSLSRRWRAGDAVELTLEMEPVLVAPNPRIDAVRGCLAVQRGPLVYCFEQRDQPQGVDLLDAQLDAGRPLAAQWTPDLLGGVVRIEAGGKALNPAGWESSLYRAAAQLEPLEARPVTLAAVPYFAWGNRGLDTMRIWMPAAQAAVSG